MKRGSAQEAASAEHYDAVYSVSPKYQGPAKDAPWAPVWAWVASGIHPVDRVLDLGCGPGHLAEFLQARGFDVSRYRGLDFSPVAIRQARARVPGAEFCVSALPGGLRSHIERWRPTVLVATEVLEHLSDEDEAEIIGIAKERDLELVVTVPKKDSKTHLRYFPTYRDVERYYGVEAHEIHPHWWGLLLS